MPQQCAGCGKEATMQCPSCLKLKINDGSHFCSQTCFKANWSKHKVVHKAAKEAARMKSGPLTWEGFEFSGPLRPWPQSSKRHVPESIVKPDYALSGIPVSEQEMRGSSKIRCLNDEQIAKMRKVCLYGREVLDVAGRMIAPGVTTDDIDKAVHEACLERNCYPSPLNYYDFPKSCCTSVNEVVCHGIPDGYALKEGDIVNVDISVYHDGFHGDLNETFFVGKVDDESKKLVRVTYECLDQAIKACKPGMRYRDIGNIISKHAHAEGFSVVRTYCGHGINQLFHTTPSVPHYARNKAIGVLKPGQTFTIEPMINVGSYHEFSWPDNWTSTTKDGKRSAQFEHTLLVTEEGVEILTARLPDSPVGDVWFETAK